MAAAENITIRSNDVLESWRAAMKSSVPAGAFRLEEVNQYRVELTRLCKVYHLNDPLLWAQAMHETGKFTSDLWAENRNPCGMKDSNGKYERFRNAVDAARAHVARILWYIGEETKGEIGQYQYLIGGRGRVQDYIRSLSHPVVTLADLSKNGKGWAEDQFYGEKVARLYTALFQDTAAHPIAVLLVSGHRNRSGGNPAEIERTDDLARAYKAACKEAGVWVDWLQELDGDTDPSWTSGDLAFVARRANEWMLNQRASARVPIMLDLHFEGGGASGCFAVIPDAPGDAWEDNEVDRALAGHLVSAIHGATTLPIRSTGVRLPGLMSEKQTGVGLQGYRLGMFSLTVESRQFAIRLVIEHGALDRMPDRALINGSQFYGYIQDAANAGLIGFVRENRARLERLAVL